MTAGPRVKLLLLLALFASPALAAWLVYTWWQPARFTNYGTLLSPRHLELPTLRDATGQPRAWNDLRGKWVLLVATPGVCDDRCGRDSYLARQVRLAQGRDQARIERVLLAAGDAVAWPHRDGAYVATSESLSGPLAEGGLFLVDPLGNLMMRFPREADGERVIRDLKKLLSASRTG